VLEMLDRLDDKIARYETCMMPVEQALRRKSA
jgi:hypothetical protein